MQILIRFLIHSSMRSFFTLLLFVPVFSSANEQPRVGREAATQYLGGSPKRAVSQELTQPDHYLALHLGKLTSSQAWEWGGSGRQDNVNGFNAGLTYRLVEWSGTTDFGVRVDFGEYDVAGEKPLKMSLMPIMLFPDATSRFPLYFGFAGGLGIFFKQLKDESSLSLDYQLLAGARFFNVFENTGFFVESGLKNFMLLTSSGQLNAVFLTAGAVFTF